MSRRITHPHLTYSSTGTLICQICHIQVKTEALWKKHLESTSHTTSLQRSREAAATAPALVENTNRANGSKKRKADDDSSDEDTRKRTRAQDSSHSIEREEQIVTRPEITYREALSTEDQTQKRFRADEESQPNPPITDQEPQPNARPSISSIQPPAQTDNHINEDEWAAFQREVASPPPEPSAFTAAADISAAPMTAAELAAQSREQASRQAKERMEADLEGEKEDAARQMEEELDEMAELEDRVRRLREKRELLRVQRGEGKAGGGIAGEEKVPPDEVVQEEEGSHDDTDDDEEDEWCVWGR
ncbi:MAG: hypothetical protein Q9226_000090 [Calogaya cf. arnoldii]